MVEDIRYRSEYKINQVVRTNFTISIKSSDYLSNTTLHWSCTQWGEWTSRRDGTCGYVIRPLHDGEMARGQLQYKFNQTCSKFSYCIIYVDVGSSLIFHPRVVQLDVICDTCREATVIFINTF